jgi:PAS domain S-box-containing protein
MKSDPNPPLEQTVAELRGCLQALLQYAETSLVLLDSDGVICLWNPASEQLFGYRSEEMLGRADTFLIPADRLEEMHQMRHRALTGEVQEGVRTERLARDGRRIGVHLSLCPLRDAADRIVSVVEIARLLNHKPPPSAEDETAWNKADRELESLLASLPGEGGQGAKMVGHSPVFQEVRRQIGRFGPTEATVLILGESGTGKELVAREIHQTSERRKKPFVAINCAALPRELLENELFGHERGAFTGAIRRKIGQLEIAEGGTAFLDEICELPLDLQPKLLRVLEERTFTRIGDVREKKLDVRFLAATNRSISQCVRDGIFRADLYYRLSVTRLSLPPLRQRLDDLPLLAETLLGRIAHLHHRPTKPLAADAEALLAQHSWPGNVRELRNILEQGFLLSEETEITGGDLAPLFDSGDSSDEFQTGFSTSASLEQVEAEHIRRVLDSVHWRKTEAASILGIGRDTLYRKLRKYGLDA